MFEVKAGAELDELFAQGDSDGFGPCRRAKFVEDGVQVLFYAVGAHSQLDGDVPVGKSPCYGVEDFALALRKLPRVRFFLGVSCDVLGESRAAVRHGEESRDQFVVRGVFGDGSGGTVACGVGGQFPDDADDGMGGRVADARTRNFEVHGEFRPADRRHECF